MKELGPLGGHILGAPPRSTNADAYVHKSDNFAHYFMDALCAMHRGLQAAWPQFKKGCSAPLDRMLGPTQRDPQPHYHNNHKLMLCSPALLTCLV